MREILFRGKRKDNGEWVEGYYVHCGISGKDFIFPNNSEDNESQLVGEEGCLKILTFEVVPETIGQYTGLKDCNGKKIFEGDRVTDGNDFVIDEYQDGGIIKYSVEDGMFIIANDIISSSFDFYRSDEFMVTGNIYDDQKG